MYKAPPSLKQVSQMLEGAFGLVMQGRVIPSSESTRAKPSKCVRCFDSLFGHDQEGVTFVTEREDGDPTWMRAWALPELCPLCEHFVHTDGCGGKNCMSKHLTEHFHQSLVQGILIRARWPHTCLLERCRMAEELRASQTCPGLIPHEFLGDGWKPDAWGCIHWTQPEETRFKARDWEYWNIEAAELNVQRAIDEDSPISHRCESQHFNPSKVGSLILGSPCENWHLATLPDARDGSYTDEVPSRLRECLQVLRDAVRSGQKQFGVHERIVGQGDSSEEVLDMGLSLTDGTARCTRCGSLSCNLFPTICARQKMFELFREFYRLILDY